MSEEASRWRWFYVVGILLILSLVVTFYVQSVSFLDSSFAEEVQEEEEEGEEGEGSPPPGSENNLTLAKFQRVPWDLYTGRGGRIYLTTASRDHRNYGPLQHLPHATRPWTFAEVSEPGDVIIQFHFALAREVTYAKPHGEFDRVELWLWNGWGDVALQSGTDVDRLEQHVTRSGSRLRAKKCLADMPQGWQWRATLDLQTMEWVARCVWANHENAVRATLAAGGNAAFALYAAHDLALIPVSQVLHYPNLERPLEAKLSPVRSDTATGQERVAERFPTAPWRKDPRLRAALESIKRTPTLPPPPSSSVTAESKVAVATMKKFTWNADDELWVLWMLDIVGVDMVILNIATAILDLSFVEERLSKHPGVLDRVTLIAQEAKPRPVVYDFMSEAMAWDVQVRWQSHFEYAFIIDLDEYVQLFNPDPPYERVDAKTFIARYRDHLPVHGQQAGFERLQVKRSQKNRDEEPGLAKFLCSLLVMNGSAMSDFLITKNHLHGDDLQKSMFWIPGSVTPYLHHNQYAPQQKWNVAEGHMLHIREKLGLDITGLLRQLEPLLPDVVPSSAQ